MSTRIEHAHPLAILRELPSQWAQTSITSPPSHDTEEMLAVFAEVHRVLREDGTLWLLTQPTETLLAGLLDQGWLRQPFPAWARALAGNPALRPVLLTKNKRFFQRKLHIRTNVERRGVSRRGERCTGCPRGRRELIERCVLACSSMLACGACGAAYRPPRASDHAPHAQHTSCIHLNPDGRCLVLDPFHDPRNATSEIAASHGRSFLGITGEAQR